MTNFSVRGGAKNWWDGRSREKTFKLGFLENRVREARAKAHNENPGRKWVIFQSCVARYNVLSLVRAAKFGELTVANSYMRKRKN